MPDDGCLYALPCKAAGVWLPAMGVTSALPRVIVIVLILLGLLIVLVFLLVLFHFFVVLVVVTLIRVVGIVIVRAGIPGVSVIPITGIVGSIGSIVMPVPIPRRLVPIPTGRRIVRVVIAIISPLRRPVIVRVAVIRVIVRGFRVIWQGVIEVLGWLIPEWFDGVVVEQS